MQFQDGSITIQPSDATDGYTIKAIGFSGVQNSIKIIDQVLDSFVSTPGIVDSSDSIVTMANKFASSIDTNYSGLHITSNSSSNTNLTAFQRFVIIDPSVTGKTVTLPSPSASGVIPWTEYIFVVGGGLVTSNTIAVPSGAYLNNTLNGTYTLSGLLSGWVRTGATSDGSRWFVAA